MKFTIFTLLSCVLFIFSASAQNPYAIKGSVADTASNSKLKNTSISVLNAKDSTLVKFTRANAEGNFSINNLKKGKFILMVTYPEYADYVEQFTLDSAHTTHNFGKLKMLLKAKVLADVIVKAQRAAIKIKGDTTEFDAKAFKVQPNATVEDLLKQLPGVQVDKDGKITAQGQTVTKVLVDGEEFFGDDPTLVTKNLRADMVDKFQLYDKKSDQATFTGIDDGQKTKTINVQLKADKKNGYFGKAEAGAGSDGYYQGSLMYNRFKAKSKFALYGLTGNNGKIGLGWEDSQKYGDSGAFQFSDDGGFMVSIGGGGNDGLDSFGGQYDGHGIPVARTGGAHFDTKWNKDKESINANYKIGSLTVDGTDNTINQNNTKDTSVNTTSDQKLHNYIFRQKADATYKVKLDTTSDLKIAVDGTVKNTQTRSNYNSTSRLNDTTLLNSSTRNVINNTDSKVFDANAFYTKKFKKKGRTFSLAVAESITTNNAHGNLNSRTDYYQSGKDSVLNIDQYKTSKSYSSVLNANATYTEPLSKKFTLAVNYAFGYNHGTSDLRSFNPSSPGNYNIQVDSLSSDYRINVLSNQVGAMFNYKGKKSFLNFGTKVSNQSYDQFNVFTNTPFKRDFITWAPQASWQYRFSQSQFLFINYRGSAIQPTISQLQPVASDNDPNNIIVGNPDLRPSFSNHFNFYYNAYKTLSGQSIFINGGYSFVSNPIVSDVTTDLTQGKTVTVYQNLSGKQSSNFNLNGSFERKIPVINFSVGIDLGVNGSTSYAISNGDINKSIYNTYSTHLKISRFVEKKFDIYASFGPSYTFSNSSLLTNVNNNGRGFNANAFTNFYLPAKFQIGADVDYEYTAKTQTFNQDLKRTLLNANISKTFFKNDDLKLAFGANDLLNQNVGFTRSINGNNISQDSYTTIKRYFMFTVTWSFNSMNAGAPKK